MKTSVKAALFGLLYAALAFISFVTDKAVLGHVMFLAAIITLAASFICESVEKRS